MKFIDLHAQQQRIRPEIERRIQAVLDHGQYILGPEVDELEQRLSDYIGAPHAIAVGSGTDALLIALLALEIRPGDEVITSPFSFIATAEMIQMLGAEPVFVDIDPDTYLLDPAGIEAAITPRTRAILPVSLFGQPADLDPIHEIAAGHDLPVIEDAAQSFGARYRGRQSGALSTIACTSFFPSKPLGGYGDSGACFTHEPELADRMRRIRAHGEARRYHHTTLGINGRMNTLQAAILLPKLDIFPDELARRQCVAEYYANRLKALVPDHVTPPHVHSDRTSAFAQYTIQLSNRDLVQQTLQARDIPTAVYYPTTLPRQPVCADGRDQSFPNADRASQHVLSLPMHPYLTEADQENVVQALAAAVTESVA